MNCAVMASRSLRHTLPANACDSDPGCWTATRRCVVRARALRLVLSIGSACSRVLPDCTSLESRPQSAAVRRSRRWMRGTTSGREPSTEWTAARPAAAMHCTASSIASVPAMHLQQQSCTHCCSNSLRRRHSSSARPRPASTFDSGRLQLGECRRHRAVAERKLGRCAPLKPRCCAKWPMQRPVRTPRAGEG